MPLRAAAAITVLCVMPARAVAYTYETSLSSGCHEQLSFDALRAVRGAGLAAWQKPSTDDLALIRDVQFEVPSDMTDIGAVSLALGNRDNDTKGLSGLDPKDLADVHGTDEYQPEHCLRRAEHDGAEGSKVALAECRAYIRGQALRALAGLNGAGQVDASVLSELRVYFDF